MFSTKEERYLCGPRLLSAFDLERDTFGYVRESLTDIQLEAADGSSAVMIVKALGTNGLSVGPKPNPVRCSLVGGFLQTRFSATKIW